MGLRQASIALLLLAAGFASWLVLRRSEENARNAANGAPASPTGATASPAGTPARDGRDNAPATLERPAADALPEPVGGAAPAASLAAGLREIQDSFLGDAPRAAELLQRIEELAERAVVDPASVTLQRDSAGVLKLARGTLTAGDLAGRFHVEDGTYRIQFTEATKTDPWIRRNLQIAFERPEGRPTRCVAVVQFETDESAPASTPPGGGDERLSGWTIEVTPGAGAWLRPLTVIARDGEWKFGSSRDAELRNVPDGARIEAFETWFRVLEPALRK